MRNRSVAEGRGTSLGFAARGGLQVSEQRTHRHHRALARAIVLDILTRPPESLDGLIAEESEQADVLRAVRPGALLLVNGQHAVSLGFVRRELEAGAVGKQGAGEARGPAVALNEQCLELLARRLRALFGLSQGRGREQQHREDGERFVHCDLGFSRCVPRRASLLLRRGAGGLSRLGPLKLAILSQSRSRAGPDSDAGSGFDSNRGEITFRYRRFWGSDELEGHISGLPTNRS